ncbi:MAG TPA: hypothetical protein VFK13_08680 [Gemmatimonadaceae bacterium]|nr:hypothetical protein [Gemmatimonadaceae bacterium]
MIIRLARVAIGIALLLTALLALSLPLPPRLNAEWTALLLLLLMLVAECVVLVRLPRRSTLARGLAYALGAYGALTLGRCGWLIVHRGTTATTVSALLVCVLALMLLVAAIAVFRDHMDTRTVPRAS